jgi:single-strand DNA-binding protein
MTEARTPAKGAPTKVPKARATQTKAPNLKVVAKAGSAKAGPAKVRQERDGLNLAVVRGLVSSAPEVRVLPSETVLVQLQVTTRLETETLSIPVSCWNPAAWVETLGPGEEIVVVGRVRRRFFRARGATASRVELEADVISRASDRRRVQAAMRRATAGLQSLE